jgi:NAD-dependent deacetylase
MDLSPELGAAAEALRAADRVVVFTGAGVSAESGIATFRDRGGLWERYPPERFATWGGLVRTAVLEPAMLASFLHDVLAPIAHATPNPAHHAIAELEQHVHATVVTQNIDGLHQQAGSHGVRQVHGSMLEVADQHGRVIRRLSRAELGQICDALARAVDRRLPLLRALRAVQPLFGLSRRGLHRPNVVLFGEMLQQPDWDDAQRGAEQCDAMIVVGTSGMVVPAAELPLRATLRGATVILVDPAADLPADIHLPGPAGTLMPLLVRHAFAAT